MDLLKRWTLPPIIRHGGTAPGSKVKDAANVESVRRAKRTFTEGLDGGWQIIFKLELQSVIHGIIACLKYNESLRIYLFIFITLNLMFSAYTPITSGNG